MIGAAIARHPPPAEPIFESVHQALLFAYTFSACQYAQSAVAERQILALGRQRYEQIRHISRGLGGLDGAAQAGMVKRQVDQLPAQQRFAIEARFAVLDHKLRRQAMRALVLGVRQTKHPIELRFTAHLVQQHFGASVNLRALARQLRLGEATAYRRAKQIREHLDRLDEQAFVRLDEQLKTTQIVTRS